jgi:hypothetical protein
MLASPESKFYSFDPKFVRLMAGQHAPAMHDERVAVIEIIRQLIQPRGMAAPELGDLQGCGLGSHDRSGKSRPRIRVLVDAGDVVGE